MMFFKQLNWSLFTPMIGSAVQSVLWIIVLNTPCFASGSNCSDTTATRNLSHVRMCSMDSYSGGTFVIDTFDSPSTGSVKCKCSFNTMSINSSTTIHIKRQNELSNTVDKCGSVIYFNNSENNISYNCNTTEDIFVELWNMTPSLDMIWMSTSALDDSKYCFVVNVTTSPENITVVCEMDMYTSTPVTENGTLNDIQNKTMDTKTTSKSTATTQQTIASTDNSSPENITVVFEMEMNGTVNTETTGKSTATSQQTIASTDNYSIIGTAAGGGVLFVVVLVAVIVLCIRHKNSSKPETNQDGRIRSTTGGNYIDSSLQVSSSMPRPYDRNNRISQFESVHTDIDTGRTHSTRNMFN